MYLNMPHCKENTWECYIACASHLSHVKIIRILLLYMIYLIGNIILAAHVALITLLVKLTEKKPSKEFFLLNKSGIYF